MTEWDELICHTCNGIKMEEASKSCGDVLYRCPKCGHEVVLRKIEDYDEH